MLLMFLILILILLVLFFMLLILFFVFLVFIILSDPLSTKKLQKKLIFYGGTLCSL